VIAASVAELVSDVLGIGIGSGLGVWAAEGVDAKGGPGEDSFCRVCSPIAVAMGQKAGKKWTAAAVLQPTFLLPPTLLVMVPALLWRFQAMGARGAGHKPGQGAVTSLTVICFTSATAARKHSRISNFEKPLSRQKAALVATLTLGVVSRL